MPCADVLPELPRQAGSLRHWAGLRPLTPDGRPIVGRSAIPNLFLNTGHGPLGWTLACGSALALADLIDGRASRDRPRPLRLAARSLILKRAASSAGSTSLRPQRPGPTLAKPIR